MTKSDRMRLAMDDSRTSATMANASQQCLEEHCFDAWAEHHKSFADRRRVRETRPDQTWQLTDWTLHDVRLRQFATGAEEVVRRPEHVRRSFSEHLAFYVSLSGRRHMMVGDDILSLQPDSIQIHDLKLPSRYCTPRSISSLVVNVPYAAIGYDPSSHASTMSILTSSPVGTILHNAITTLCRQASQVTSDEAPRLATGFCGLLRGMIHTRNADPEARQIAANARLELIKAYIDRHVQDPALDAALLCRTFAISRATLYRLFASEGGVTSYLTHSRLVNALSRLRTTTPARGSVRAIAEELGFHDHSHFNRLFRNKFHISPSDALGLWVDPRPVKPRRD